MQYWLEMLLGGWGLTTIYFVVKDWREKRPQHVRGTRLGERGPRSTAEKKGPYFWGGRFLSFEQMCKHTVVVGSTGSGKTLAILLLLKTVLRRVMKADTRTRALVYDSKSDLLSSIRGMGVGENQIVILNPFDERCSGWDLSRDILTPAEADDMAGILIPKGPGEKDPYFVDTAQRFLSGIIEVFQERAEKNWELRDLILASRNTRRLRAILSSSPNTNDLIEHLEPYSTFRSVKSTLDGNLRAYRSIAASWHVAKGIGRSFSISEWLRSQSVLVMGNSPKAKLPILRVNQLLFTAISKAILDRQGRRQEETFLFLDEFRELGKLNSIADLMITGRSKGAAIVLGFQDIFGVDSVYGREQSREIIGCAQNLGVLHINSSQPDTQRWASEVLGDHEVKRMELGNSRTSGGGRITGQVSESYSYRHKTEKVWLPSQFSTELPPVDKQDGLSGLFRVGSEFFTHRYSWARLFGEQKSVLSIPSPVSTFPNQVPVKRSRLLLKDWNRNDLVRLGLLEVLVKKDEPRDGHGEDLLQRRRPVTKSAA